MSAVVDTVAGWLAGGRSVALATVVSTRRSAPRPVGAKLAVADDGSIAGSVSGGCVEPDVYEVAREVLAGGDARVVTYGISDELAATVGLPCGGEIDILVERLDAGSPLTAPTGSALLVSTTDGRRVVGAGEDPEVDALLRAGRSGVIERGSGAVFCEVFAPPARLVVVGAVDLADALADAAAPLGWRTIVVDPRERFATRDRLPSADEIVVAWPGDAVARLRPDAATAVVVVAHDEKLDVPALAAALASDAFYVGALGSRRTQARRRELLAGAGVAEESIDRIAGPAGLDLGAEAPAEIALAIVAEIVAVRNARAGGRLTDARGRVRTALPA